MHLKLYVLFKNKDGPFLIFYADGGKLISTLRIVTAGFEPVYQSLKGL